MARHIQAGLFTTLAILLIALVELKASSLFLLAPFGATSMILFGLPDGPYGSARNVLGGHLISASVGLAFLSLFPDSPLTIALATGTAVTAMLMTKTVHPAAAGYPILIIKLKAAWMFLLNPLLPGLLLLLACREVQRRANRNSP